MNKRFSSIFSLNILTILALFLLAFSIRSFWVSSYFGQDEGHYVGFATDIIKKTTLENLYPFQLCWICFWPIYFLTPFMFFFGSNPLYIHIFSAFIGSLAIPLVYLIGKKFFNYWIGLLAALLLTFSQTHWFYSAWAQLDAPGALFSTLALYFLWSGYKELNYKKLFIGSIFTIIAEGTRYSVFPVASLFLYLLLFDRKSLKNKKILIAIFLPVIVYGIWFVYDSLNRPAHWDWWIYSFTTEPDYTMPFYFYSQFIYLEYFTPILTFFILSASAVLLLKRYYPSKSRNYEYLFLLYFIYNLTLPFIFHFGSFTCAIFGFSSFILLCAYYFRTKDFNKLLIIYVILILVFFSMFAKKFTRYVTLVLPILYLIAAQLFYEIRKDKNFFTVAIIVLILYLIVNSVNAIAALLIDQKFSEMRYKSEMYALQNSPPCSSIYSYQYYLFYYIRENISYLPKNLTDFKIAVKSQCNCPPKFILDFSDNVSVDYLTSDVFKENKSFVMNISLPSDDFLKPKNYTFNVTTVYQIKDSFIRELCANTSI